MLQSCEAQITSGNNSAWWGSVFSGQWVETSLIKLPKSTAVRTCFLPNTIDPLNNANLSAHTTSKPRSPVEGFNINMHNCVPEQHLFVSISLSTCTMKRKNLRTYSDTWTLFVLCAFNAYMLLPFSLALLCAYAYSFIPKSRKFDYNRPNSERE